MQVRSMYVRTYICRLLVNGFPCTMNDITVNYPTVITYVSMLLLCIPQSSFLVIYYIAGKLFYL